MKPLSTVILSEAKGPAGERIATVALGAGFSSPGQMLHCVQHDKCGVGYFAGSAAQDDKAYSAQGFTRVHVRGGCGLRRHRRGFSLGEMMAAVVIGAMVLAAVLRIYGRANRAAEAVLTKVQSPSLASEVLQLIAEDIGRSLGADDLIVQIRNGFDNGFARAELVLRRTFRDYENKEQTLEEIIWRAGYDRGGPTPGLVLYRSYNGVGQEDKLLDRQRDIWEKSYPFVPVCRGVTFFQIQACKGEDLVEQWPPSAPPVGIKVTISFAEPYETVRGTKDVRDDQRIGRTIAVDPTRKIKFTLNVAADPNAAGDPNAQPPARQTPDNRTLGSRVIDERTMNQQSLGSRMPNEQMPTRTR